MKQDIREIIEIHNILNSYKIYHNILLLISIHVILQVVALLRKCGEALGPVAAGPETTRCLPT